MPQALLDIKPRGYVGPDEWDAGSSMGFVNYDASFYRSSFDGVGGNGDSDYGYLGLSGGINFGLWRLRHQSNYSYSSYAGNTRSDWNSIRTYAQRAVPGLRSELTLGESFTEGNLFGSLGYRGVRLASDDRMLADSQRRYAPQVRRYSEQQRTGGHQPERQEGPRIRRRSRSLRHQRPLWHRLRRRSGCPSD
ncbi:fimbria/pilus outer membrane usher protein [Pseudomonas aeruginosa]|uniref:fimbria/pilus outer membrane usher protein n=1 Tax=Pseudomonas aeruginosa TaxID=287 RepID=UPI00216304C9|nr:fimbria/pilus outer membrane usher protein [Pseudomonas aeruginosa]